jgi:hypothetical protein
VTEVEDSPDEAAEYSTRDGCSKVGVGLKARDLSGHASDINSTPTVGNGC